MYCYLYLQGEIADRWIRDAKHGSVYDIIENISKKILIGIEISNEYEFKNPIYYKNFIVDYNEITRTFGIFGK